MQDPPEDLENREMAVEVSDEDDDFFFLPIIYLNFLNVNKI